MCIQLKKSFLAEEGITTNYDGIHLKNCDQERVSGRIKQKKGQTHFLCHLYTFYFVMLKSDQSKGKRERIEQTCILGFLINSTIDYTPGPE